MEKELVPSAVTGQHARVAVPRSLNREGRVLCVELRPAAVATEDRPLSDCNSAS